jgi:hypothetical protein
VDEHHLRDVGPLVHGARLSRDARSQKEFTLYDEGEGRFSVTAEYNTALGLINTLIRKPAETKNQNVLLSELVTTSKELLAEIEQ